MKDDWKAVWSIPFVSVAFFLSLKQNIFAYRSSKVSSHLDSISEIHQLWKSGFSRVYSNSWCCCFFEPEIIKIGQSSHKISSNDIQNFQVYDNFKCLYKKSLETHWRHHVYIYIYIYIYYLSFIYWRKLALSIIHNQDRIVKAATWCNNLKCRRQADTIWFLCNRINA